jgi:hypothetical protein
LAIAVAYFTVAAFSRLMGKRLETRLFDKWGGKPSVIVLRHGDTTFDDVSKDRYRTFLASKIGFPAPTLQAERKDQAAADVFYESAGNWLRECVRSNRQLSLVFEENVAYGFWRNLLGLKWITILFDVPIATFLIFKVQGTQDSMVWLTLLTITVLQAIFMLLVVTERTVKTAAFQYARQLVLACEALMASQTSMIGKVSATR